MKNDNESKKIKAPDELTDEQTKQIVGGFGEWTDIHYDGVKNCPRGVTEETFPNEDCAIGQHWCDYLNERDLGDGHCCYICAKFRFSKDDKQPNVIRWLKTSW